MQNHIVIMAGGRKPFLAYEYPRISQTVYRRNGSWKIADSAHSGAFQGYLPERELLGGDIGKVCRHSKGTASADSGSAYSGGTGSKEYGAVYRVCMLEDPKGVSAGEHRGDAFGCAGD